MENRLDGNAAAGILQEIFPFEMTLAHTTCAGCGRSDDIGALATYVHGMGNNPALFVLRSSIDPRPMCKDATGWICEVSASFKLTLQQHEPMTNNHVRFAPRALAL